MGARVGAPRNIAAYGEGERQGSDRGQWSTKERVSRARGLLKGNKGRSRARGVKRKGLASQRESVKGKEVAKGKG